MVATEPAGITKLYRPPAVVTVRDRSELLLVGEATPRHDRRAAWPDAPADRDERAEDIDRLLGGPGKQRHPPAQSASGSRAYIGIRPAELRRRAQQTYPGA
ncbi:MAG: hypothetical protein JO325_10210 [Solirubrobacterales bacterium]|nr:hypothetical protein [Solirubrobacterales bacterium]